MEQGWLLGKRVDTAAVRDTFQDLTAAARDMVPPDRRADLEAYLESVADDWELSFDSLWRVEEIEAAEDELNARWDAEEDHVALRERVLTAQLTTPEVFPERL